MSREVKPCGTRAAYQRHQVAGEEPCDLCTTANRVRSREAMAKRRGRPPVVLPVVVQGSGDVGPCTRSENGFLWDPTREGEDVWVARDRWKAASMVCVTACPVFVECERVRPVDAVGVWAGRIPGRPR